MENKENTNEAVSEDNKLPKAFGIILKISGVCGRVIEMLIDGAAKSVNIVITSIIPAFAFISLLVGIVQYTGIADGVAEIMGPRLGTIFGILIIGIIISIPVISPIIAAGAAFPGVCSAILGAMLISGDLQPAMALPALFAIDAACACDFIAPGLALGEAEKETIFVAYPAVMCSHLICAPIAILIAYGISLLSKWYI